MGVQLGPGFLRHAPRGWLAAQASAVAHRRKVDAWIDPGDPGAICPGR